MTQLSIPLRDGTKTSDPRLDRLKQFDPRSKEPKYRAVRKGASRRLRSYTQNFRKYQFWLDQGAEGACVGFGFAHELLCYPQEIQTTDLIARGFYHAAQRRDPWPGGSYPGASPVYEGTSVLAGGLSVLEWLAEFYPEKKYQLNWCFGGDDVLLTLGRRPVVIGVNWYEGMFDTNESGLIVPSGRLAGGHCTLLRGSKVKFRKNVTHYEPKDVERELTVIKGRNSWGRGWGLDGDFLITLSDLDRLLAEDGEACTIDPVKA